MGSSTGSSPAFIAVGSNIEPERNIVAALMELKQAVSVRASSTFYRTEPLGRKGQPDFINGVWRVETSLSPTQITDNVLKPIETQFGRVRTEDKFAPRTIDLDLVLYGSLVSSDGDLSLPHPDVRRSFVCVPILELLESGCDEIEASLRDAMKALLPLSGADTTPGEPLQEFTRRLRRLIC